MNSEIGVTRRLALSETAGRWVLAATVLGSGMALLDTTTVTVALPAIGRQLGGGVTTLQWVLAAYLVTFGGLVLLGGAVADVIGRERAFLIGAAGFGVTSALCGVAPTGSTLVIARLLQGAAAGLLVPGSLGIVSTSFSADERGRVIATWSALSGLATAAGPLLGGLLVDRAGWRWVFLINVPLALVAVGASLRNLPAHEASARSLGDGLDLGGALTGTAGLGLTGFGLIQAPQLSHLLAAACVLLGIGLLVAFAILESRQERPLLPLTLFEVRDFTVANLATLLVYAALSSTLFLVVVQLQDGSGYSALGAGAAIFPVTLLLLLLATRLGVLVRRFGARRLMTLGPLVAALGLLLFSRVGAPAAYATVVLPAAAVFGLGVVLTVAPLTSTVLGSVASTRAAIASAVNNAIARVAGLLAVAAMPLAAGLSGSNPTPAAGTAAAAADTLGHGFHRAMLLATLLCVAAAAVSFIGLRHKRDAPAVSPLPAR